ncbi:type I polyketide synthase [Teichococcus wenyumeiae]|uniref:type I polyketide synthase n=1 Tax=Teichococcus wenyumeiae TaxID=2478470 RepID=UPI001F2044DE|nr:type I polyketide synthase [Pseudoroseomonas wenyumeiae]
MYQTELRAWTHGGCLQALPGAPANLAAALRQAAQSGAGIFYAEDHRQQSYAELLQQASSIAGSLRAQGLRDGEPVVLQLDNAADVLPAVWACFLHGYTAVPVAPVAEFTNGHAEARRLRAAIDVLNDPLVVVPDDRLEEWRGRNVGSRVVSLRELRQDSAKERPKEPGPESPALLLLTSGSTGTPKGVPLTHANLLAMAAGTAQMNGFGAAHAALNWMPLDHAGALIFLSVMPVLLGASQVHIPTRRVVERPLLWLELIARHRAAISWAPNFAFSLINNAAEELQRAALDLSCLRFLVNAGEQVTARTALDFLTLLAPYGVPQDVLRPAFGMSETCSGITWSAGLTPACLAQEGSYVSLGRPIPGAEIRITCEDGAVLAEGEVGRLELRGASVITGYHANPAADAEAFTDDGWFRSGDLGFIRDGELYLTGREKEELAINGRKVPLHDVEASVAMVPGVMPAFTCAFGVRQADTDGLVVTFCAEERDQAAWPALVRAIRAHLVRDMRLSPVQVVPLAASDVPKSSIGKIQRRSLQASYMAGNFTEVTNRFDTAPGRAAAGTPLSAVEERVAAIWRAVLDLQHVGRDENFFDLGGHSLLLIKAQSMLEAAFGPVTLGDLFAHSTVAMQARFLSGTKEDVVPRPVRRSADGRRVDIAVIGMACRFPGADTIDEFWRNLRDGVESIRTFTAAEAVREGADPRSAQQPGYVAASPVLNDAAGFDATFFGLTDREAELMDPQHRLFLECCWEAMEDAGQDTLSAPGSVGVYAGASMNTYLLNNVLPARAGLDPQDDLRSVTLDSMGGFQLMVANDKDYLASRVSYKLNLRGPSINTQTACSTGLVVIHQAVQSLLAGECDMAIAGTSSVQAPQLAGHLHQEGMIVAPDGHCRAFDADARGTIFGSGVGAVVLKRLDDALAAGDRVLAVVKGTAVNNDGLRKVGYMAPSEAGESEVVRAALDVAGVPADSIGFVEAHGTGTEIGDPIEVASLTRAWRHDTTRTGFCALGSVKTNIGHLQISSGIAGFIKAVLVLQHRQIPPTLHYRRPNPAIAFERTPFFVNTEALHWVESETPRRAGVNSLGIGGTNAHVILEEAPARPRRAAGDTREWYLLPLSARSPAALAALLARYRDRLLADPALDCADLCYSAATGRHHFAHRFAAVFTGRDTLLAALDAALAGPPDTARAPVGDVAFLFTGQGAQHTGMALGLYREEPVFRDALDRCAALLRAEDGFDLPAALQGEALGETAQAQPALFAVEYALATLWQAWGLRPAALLGHSLGEYVAACLAGVFSLEDGLRLVAARARLMQALPRDGAMISLSADPDRVRAALAPYRDTVSVAALNGAASTVVSGRAADVAALAARLEADGVQGIALRTSHAFHSPLMRPMLEAFRAVLATVTLRPPSLPLVSNLTGAVETALFTEPDYWLRHVMEPVRFAQGVATLEALGCATLVEIGPRPVLAGLVRGSACVLPSLRPGVADARQMLESLAELYRRGLTVHWDALHDATLRQRVPLPSYPFQHRRYWIEPRPQAPQAQDAALHPLAHRRLRLPGLPHSVFETTLEARRLPLLEHHRVHGRVLVAGAGYLSMLLAGAALLTGREAQVLREVSFVEPLLLPEHGGWTVQMQFLPLPQGQEARLVGFDAAAEEGDHRLHVTATLAADVAPPPAPPDFAALRERCPRLLEAATLYARLADRHIALGPQFRWLERIWLGQDEAVFEVAPPSGEAVDPAFQLHPGLLDSLLQPALAVLAMGQGNDTYVPVALESFRFHARPAAFPLRGYVRRRGAAQDLADILVCDATDACVAEVHGFEFRRLDAGRVGAASPLDAALYAVAWDECPAPAAAAAEFPAPAVLMADDAVLRHGLDAPLAAVNSPRYQQQSEDLEALGLAYLVEAFKEVGALPQPGAWRGTEEIARRLALVPGQDRLLRRLLHILERHGRLLGRDGGWEALECPPALSSAAQRARVEARHGTAAEAELALLAACGTQLGAILRGEADPLEALFPGGDLGPATRLYQDSAGFGALNGLVANLVERLAQGLPAGRRLRILEVGAGTGATSHYVLRRLDAARVDYVFTDVSPLFLARARGKFAAWPGMDYRLLDIERDPAEQGIEPGSVDLVIAANVLHATRDLSETLAHVRRMLRPGGHLALLEVNEPTVPVDLTFGLLEGWWRFSDTALRPAYPLLSRRQWLALLRAQGFATAAAAPLEIPTPGGLQSVILAQADGVAPQRPGAWAVLGGAGPAGALATALAAAGAEARPMSEAALDAALVGGDALRGIVLVVTPGEAAAAACTAAIRLLRAQLRAGTSHPVHLVTRGALEDPAQATLQGLGRVLFAEHPDMAGNLIDRDPDEQGDTMAVLASLLLEGRAEDELALRGGRVLAARLRPLPAPRPASMPLRADGTYLITGGLGGIGLRLATALVARGARHLLLLGRGAPDAAAQAAIDALAARGVRVRTAQADVADAAALAAVLAQGEEEPPLRGVFHLAGVLHQGVLAQLSPDAFATATAAKIEGALHLDRLTRAAPLEHFVLFSSAAALLGLPGQGAYAAANAALDALARRRRAAGLPALSIGWGRWSEVGMVASDAVRLEAAGHGAIVPDAGLALLERISDGPAHQAVLPADWPRLLAGLPRRPTLLAELERPAPQPVFQPAPPAPAVPAGPAPGGMMGYLVAELQRITGAAMPPPATSTLLELGLDSLMSINLRNRIAREVGVNLPLGTLMDATLRQLAAELEARADLAGRIRMDAGPVPAEAGDAPMEEDILL